MATFVYLGAGAYEISLDTGKILTLTDVEISEIVDVNNDINYKDKKEKNEESIVGID